MDGIPEAKINELNDLFDKVDGVMSEARKPTKKEGEQLVEIFKNVNRLSKLKDKTALKNYLIHTKNELSNANR